MMLRVVALASSAWITAAVAAAAPAALQPLVDATPEGGELQLAAGVYAGPAVLRRAIRVAGAAGAVLTGGGAGTVLTLTGSGIVVEHLEIRDSGRRHETLDACVRIEGGSHNILRDNALDGCLVGIDLRQTDGNVLRRNRIRGREPQLDLRGDGVRVWRSNGNRIENNVVTGHRDVIVEYSQRNVLAGNSVSGGRYGTHFMYASGNAAIGNSYALNTVGLFSMYSNDLCLASNRIVQGDGPAGFGVGLKEASGLKVENNEILGNAVGLFLDDSPFDPDSHNLFRGNTFAFNGVGVTFHANKPGNSFEHNAFQQNYTDVVARGGDGATASVWNGNFWDAYEGFDRRGRGVGETPFELYAYADQLWADKPATAFYRGSPLFETIDFLSRLAPFSAPKLILRDEAPLTRAAPVSAPDCGG
jgi:nitrous oxidase accessory protein